MRNLILIFALISTTVFAVDNVGKYDTLTTNNPARTKIDVNKNVDLNTTGGVYLPNGTTAQRPTPIKEGMLRYNSTTDKAEIYANGVWSSVGGGISDWVTATLYSVGDVVIESQKIYQALNAHTSGTFATDLANGDWQEISAVPTNVVVGPASATDNAITRYDSTTGKLIKDSLAILDNSGNISANDLTFTDADYNTLSTKKTLSQQMSTGVIDGALLTINANPALFNLSAQVLSFSDGSTSLDTPAVKFVNCPALTAQTVTFLASADSSYVSVAPNCTLVQSTTFPTPTQRRTNAFIGRLSHSNHTSLTAASDLPDLVTDSNSQLFDLFDAIGAFNVGGNVLTPNGANLSFNRSGGVIFRRSSNYASNKQNPHTITTAAATPQSFLRATQTTINSTPFSVIDPGNYDVAGTVTAIPGANARATNKRVYLFSNGVVGIQYGQVFYANISDALAGLPNETFVVNPQATEGGVLVGIITCRKIATDMSVPTDCIISKVGRFDQSGVTAGAIATTTMQQGYDISVSPQITTTTALGAIDYKRGSAADTDKVFRVLNGAGTETAGITGSGVITGSNLSGTNTGDLTSKSKLDVSPVTTNELQTPFSQLTTTATGKRIIETGNTNELRNPNFEATTFNTDWTCSLGTASQAVSPNGYRAMSVVSTGAGFRCYQTFTSTADLKGTLARFAARIKTAATDVKMCGLDGGNATANEVGCVTINPTTADKPFDEPAGFFNYGSGVYGIVIYTTNTLTFPTVIANTSMGAYQGNPISTFSNNTGRTPYTPTFAGWGTVTNISCFYTRSTIYADFDCKFTASGGTATVLQVGFPSGLVSASNVQTNSEAGRGNASALVSSVPKGIIILKQPSVSYFNIAVDYYGSAALGAMTPVQGNTSGFIGNGVASDFSFTARVPIAGWEANTNASIAGCVDAFGCTDKFDMQVSSTGVISSPNVTGWLTGNCTVVGGAFTCPVRSGIASVQMNCIPQLTGSAATAGIALYDNVSSTNTSVIVRTTNSTTGAASPFPFLLSCTKATPDFKPKTVVVSPLQGYTRVPGGDALNIDTFSFSYGTTNNNTVCSASPCSYLDQIGTAVTSVTRSSGGVYATNFAKTYLKMKCTAAVGIASSSIAAVHPNTPLTCTSCASLNFQTTDGTIKDSFGTLVCQGTY